MGVALAHVIPNFDSAPAYVNAVFLPMIFISGVFYDAEDAPQFLYDIAEVLPLKHLIDGLSGAMVTGEGLADNGWRCSCWRCGRRRRGAGGARVLLGVAAGLRPAARRAAPANVNCGMERGRHRRASNATAPGRSCLSPLERVSHPRARAV